VQKPQKIAREMSEEGYEIIVFGDANHPEVRGVVSYCETPTYVVLDESELEPIKLSSKVAVLSQTTKKAEKFGKIVAYLTRRCKVVRVFNTICNATLKNQDAVRDLATKADVMVIVGGKNSSNTKQLHLIAKSICQNSYHVEKEEELEAAWFEGKKFCGVSAGASTPEWIIKKIVARIEKLSQNLNF
jgi:4-hydroxy-3-methylbut-2-enyl diphosphate reductase